ncbi:MAG: hypothetical protein AAFX44_00965 [Pseudomonadota bacterium]
MSKHATLVAGLLLPMTVLAQGQDSTPSERNIMIVAAALPGHFVNTNQVYFEGRLDVDEDDRHAPLTWRIEKTDDPRRFTLDIGDAVQGAIELDVVADGDRLVAQIALDDGPACRYVWTRDAAQFKATAVTGCEAPLPSTLVLAEDQLWLYAPSAATPWKLHRARKFTCHADMPGVGGGRDVPYRRYDNLELHDQGGAAWFTTAESPPRRLGVSMLLVDWPINNYEGVYARDSLVIYVSEETEAGRVEHGYAFTVPEADRIGINLKWLLAFCYRVSNTDATPVF